ncbi:MAG: hypothetical protein DMF98_27430 [Acidobacteria bacterium]|nr:MAG: hypothetical protein DMF98_27430 [Acidobacteriota bacterium]
MPIAVVGIGIVSVSVAVAERSWQALVLAAAIAGFGLAYAAPKLAPVTHFVTSDRFRDTTNPIDHPDRMTPAMVVHAYADPAQNVKSAFSSAQRHGWWEYGNYIGTLASILIVAGLAWTFAAPSIRGRPPVRAIAVTALVFFVLSLGEFSAFAPALWLWHIPTFSWFRIPSRYTIGFTLFGTMAVAAAARDLAGRIVWTPARQLVIGTVCALAVCQLVVVNRAHFRDVFSLPPLDSGFRIMKGTGEPAFDSALSARTPNSPMLRALMRGQAVLYCDESLQLTRGADSARPLVWSDERSKISSIVFTPNRVQFSAVGGFEPSRVYLNQNYAAGWRSTAGPVLLDPRDGGRPYVQLAPGQTGRFAFSFMPPGLVPGTIVLVVALVTSRLLWHRHLPAVTVGRAIADSSMTGGMLFSARAEHASRLLLLASVVCAIATRIIVVAGEQQTKLANLALISFSATFVLSLVSHTAIAGLLACTYVAPLFISRLWVNNATAYQVFLSAGLVGVMLPRWSPRHWALPVPWRVPLVGWALAVAATWPIVAAREVDFHPESAALLTKPVSNLGLPAWMAVVFTTDSAAVLILSVLWLDWLFTTFGGDRRTFTRTIIVPLLASGTAACAVATYQLLNDMSFMNEGWRPLGRAAGTMLDANALGMIALLCSCGCVACTNWRSLWSRIIAIVIVAFTSTAIWASGSRTALIAGLAAFAWIVGSAIQYGETPPSPWAVRRRRTTIAQVVVVSVVMGAALYALKDTGPARRLGWIVPSASADAVGGFLKETLWNRAGYGTAAAEMIRKNPCPVMVGDYLSHLRRPLAPDNAQNWVRHHLAELGLVGSLAWMAWAVAIVVWAARRRTSLADRRSAVSIVSALAGILVISQVGMPTQNPAVALTCWTFLFWYVLVRSPGDTTIAARSAVAPWWGWGLASAFVIVSTIGTWMVGATTLQVPMRAREAGRPYEYGFSSAHLTPSGDVFRWAPQHAVTVVAAPTRVVKLTVWTNRQDIATHPVQARVWHENHVVIDTVLHDHQPVTAYVVVDREPRWLMVRTYFDRVVPPNALELGLAVQWTFVDADPGDAGGAHVVAAR